MLADLLSVGHAGKHDRVIRGRKLGTVGSTRISVVSARKRPFCVITSSFVVPFVCLLSAQTTVASPLNLCDIKPNVCTNSVFPAFFCTTVVLLLHMFSLNGAVMEVHPRNPNPNPTLTLTRG